MRSSQMPDDRDRYVAANEFNARLCGHSPRRICPQADRTSPLQSGVGTRPTLRTAPAKAGTEAANKARVSSAVSRRRFRSVCHPEWARDLSDLWYDRAHEIVQTTGRRQKKLPANAAREIFAT